MSALAPPWSPIPEGLARARLPAWALPADWPREGLVPALADVQLAQGRVHRVSPAGLAPLAGPVWDLAGAPVLPGLVDAHTHLDKAFTLPRMGEVQPGLLGAIDAMMQDRRHWTSEDVRERASQGLRWAHEAGVVQLRSHCDWWEPQTTPVAWPVLRELAQEWQGRLQLERVSLIPLHLYAQRDTAMALAAQVAASGPGACLGGFVHSSNWDPQALRHLLEAARHHDLDVDLHVDEELNPRAQGLWHVARLVKALGLRTRVVCGHTCALAAQPEAEALATLDAVAEAGLTLVSLPITNLLLQDAVTGRTPRSRGLTLVKEARDRGIPVLLASDNVQDPFCPSGSFDPLEAFGVGVAMGQLGQAFDQWSDSLCRRDALARPGSAPPAPFSAGSPADVLIFPQANAWGFPSRTQPRVVLRQGQPLAPIPQPSFASESA
ncbi:amidohydrolase family protein [Curvibacter sp. HBC28]|uniref:Amidohydrolase family protein n=1 Tax=Curvibacter microcysteis TaxID=3026419 RepID=A0ABT5ME40_9BURK|nr:amidohydrolase family protein [Curvibacter sp. HBC28]MDD0814645.1 amidohydrolase family protein [Curvibacter sp. HBC28]